MVAWLRRYGIAEVVGVVTALLAAWLADALGANTVGVAYAGVVGENLGFYGTMITRQVAADRRAASGAYGGRGVLSTARDLLLEFGPAELLDSLVLRPLAMGIGVRFLGREAGIVAGKLVADVTFYIPVIVTYEMRRRARGRSAT